MSCPRPARKPRTVSACPSTRCTWSSTPLREFGVVEADGTGYALGPAAPDDDAAAALHHHARVVRSWSANLADRLAGVAAPPAVGRTAAERARWLQALAVSARRRAPEVADRCLQRFPDARRVLDLAGGHGEYGLEFARRGLDVTLQDLPDVVGIVEEWPAIRDAAITLVPRDAFDSIAPGPFELVLCAGFTHTMSAPRNAELFPRLAEAVDPDGGVAVVTFLRGHRPVAPLFAVQMLVAGGGGDTYSVDEYDEWLTAAGFGPVEVAHLDEGTSLLTASRRGNS